MLPVLNLLRDTAQPIAHALYRKRAEQQPQRRKAAMAQLPHELGALARGRRLPVRQPLHDARGVPGRRAGPRVRRRRRPLHQEMSVFVHGDRLALLLRDRLLEAQVARRHERRPDPKRVDLVQHALDERLHGVLGRAVRAQPGDAERARRRREDDEAAAADGLAGLAAATTARPPLTRGVLRAEQRQRRLHDVQRAHEVCLELRPQLALVLVLARRDHPVPRRVHHHVHAAERLRRPLHALRHRRPHPHVAQQAHAPLVPAAHLRQRVLLRAPDGRDAVAVRQRGLHERAPDVAGCAEDQPCFRDGQTQQYYHPPSGLGFASGFLLGQLTLALILFCFIKFFIFGEAPSPDERASTRAAARRQRTLSHTRHRTLSSALRPRPSSAVLKPRADTSGLTVQKILEKTYYNVNGHQPESLDWFNVLIAQTIAQLRADAQEDEAVLGSLTALLNGSSKPDFLDEIRVTEISLGDEFPIFSNCRVIPVDENGAPLKQLSGNRGERLQARMDVDLSDVVTLGIETKLVLNYPRPAVAVLPVALAVSVVRFSGTLSVSFSPSSTEVIPPLDETPDASPPLGAKSGKVKNEGHPLNPTGQSPTTLTFTFLDDYRLDLSVRSLIGSRSRLQDVPKIAQLVESRLHQWFDDRCVEPRFQQIVLPSLWPRKRNTRGGAADDSAVADDETTPASPTQEALDHVLSSQPQPLQSRKEGLDGVANSKTTGASLTAEQRTRDWAAQHGSPSLRPTAVSNKPSQQPSSSSKAKKEEMSELELAGMEMREAEARAARRHRPAEVGDRETDATGEGLRMRAGRSVGDPSGGRSFSGGNPSARTSTH
nr:maintenance of mitochondrial morphology protein 1 [Quercus suber]